VISDTPGEWHGFPEPFLRELAQTFPVSATRQALKETVLAPYDIPDVHRDRSPDGTPVRVVLVGSKAWDLIMAAMTEDF
jgi:hypothetical protein